MAIESNLSHAFNDGFENFFNNESLSDRILCICEVEEVECYLIDTGVKRRRNGDDAFSYPLLKTIKQEELEEEQETSSTSASRVTDEPDNVLSPSGGILSTQVIRPLIQHIKVEDDVEVVAVCTQEKEEKPAEFSNDSNSSAQLIAFVTPINNDQGSSSAAPPTTGTAIDSENEGIIPSDEASVPDAEEEVVLDFMEGAEPYRRVRIPFERANTLMTDAEYQEEENESLEVPSTALASLTSQESAEPVDDKCTDTINTHDENTYDENTHTSEPVDDKCTDTINTHDKNTHDENTHTSALRRTYTIEKKILNETKVFVHSIILAAKSDFFKCLFSTSGMKETQEKEVKLEVKKGEAETMLIMLRCFYNRDFINEHSLDDVIKVISLAMQYCFDGLIDKCLDVFATRAEAITSIEDFNRINIMVLKIQNGFNQHKDKCALVTEKCRPFLVKHFCPLDENLEKIPCKFFMLRLEAMNLFLDPIVQKCFKCPHGNLYIYAIQRWVRAHVIQLSDTNDYSKQYKLDVIAFVEKFLDIVDMRDVSSDFITNVMNYEISAFNIWPGYQEWYTKALQNFIHRTSTERPLFHRTPLPVLTREREVHFARQEKSADIFSMYPVILNGFEIGIYLRVREDRKVHMLCKCKNFQSNKVGFDKAALTFSLKGVLKLNTVTSNLWKEKFPRQLPQPGPYSNDNFTFSYKQNTMCLQMYALCKLSPAVYNIAKKNGFFIEFEIHQLTT